jgi:hypothetical protein
MSTTSLQACLKLVGCRDVSCLDELLSTSVLQHVEYCELMYHAVRENKPGALDLILRHLPANHDPTHAWCIGAISVQHADCACLEVILRHYRRFFEGYDFSRNGSPNQILLGAIHANNSFAVEKIARRVPKFLTHRPRLKELCFIDASIELGYLDVLSTLLNTIPLTRHEARRYLMATLEDFMGDKAALFLTFLRHTRFKNQNVAHATLEKQNVAHATFATPRFDGCLDNRSASCSSNGRAVPVACTSVQDEAGEEAYDTWTSIVMQVSTLEDTSCQINGSRTQTKQKLEICLVHRACALSSNAAVHLRHLLDHCGPSILYAVENGMLPVHVAAQHGNYDCLLLITKYAPETVFAHDMQGRTVCHISAEMGRVEFLHVLASKFPRLLSIPNSRDHRLPVHVAAGHICKQVFQVFKEYVPWTISMHDQGFHASPFNTVTYSAMIHHRIDIFREIAASVPHVLTRQYSQINGTLAHCFSSPVCFLRMVVKYTDGKALWVRNEDGMLPIHSAASASRDNGLIYVSIMAMLDPRTVSATCDSPGMAWDGFNAAHCACHSRSVGCLWDIIDADISVLSAVCANGRLPVHVLLADHESNRIDAWRIFRTIAEYAPCTVFMPDPLKNVFPWGRVGTLWPLEFLIAEMHMVDEYLYLFRDVAVALDADHDTGLISVVFGIMYVHSDIMSTIFERALTKRKKTQKRKGKI